MSIPLIKAISPTIVWISVFLPILTGFLGWRAVSSVMLGWLLFVVSFLFQDIFSIMLARHYHGIDGIDAVAVDQPGTVAAVFVGWIIPLVGHFIGAGARRLVQIIRDGTRLSHSSEQDTADQEPAHLDSKSE